MPSILKAIKTSDFTYEMDDYHVEIINAPDDCDWSRWGMLDDRRSTRMYCFKKDTEDQLYQFILDGEVYKFEEDMLLTITGVSDAQNNKKIAMLSTPNFEEFVGINDKDEEGNPKEGAPFLPIPQNYHVYMQTKDDQTIIDQFLWTEGTRNFRPNGITRSWFNICAFPEDTDWGRWTMTYDSNHYQLSLPAYVYYAFKQGSNSEIYFGRYGADGCKEDPNSDGEYYTAYSYEPDKHPEDVEGDQYYGQAKCGNIKIEGLSEDVQVSDISVVFDGNNTHMYLMID
ncbi:MAG: hypothetical protein P8P74_02550 [Crocinitomicaceae bacterium]|nr:hypothetical protein [Crocinitomicaceae bacterium]